MKYHEINHGTGYLFYVTIDILAVGLSCAMTHDNNDVEKYDFLSPKISDLTITAVLHLC